MVVSASGANEPVGMERAKASATEMTLLGLLAGFVVVPLLPVALLALAVVAMVRLVHPRRSRA